MNIEAPGRLSGYETWDGHDPFEDHAGPFYFRQHPDGRVTSAFEAKPHHCNGGGFLHGGLLLTFADFSLFAIGRSVLQGPSVTLSLNGEFTAAAGAANSSKRAATSCAIREAWSFCAGKCSRT